MRILALDYGTKRIGLALSDPLKMFATPKGHLLNNASFKTELKKIIDQNAVIKIILGLPNSLKNNETQMTQEVLNFKKTLQEFLSIEIELIDERLSSKQAQRALIEGNVRREKRKELVDSVAAALFLQSYLDGLKK